MWSEMVFIYWPFSNHVIWNGLIYMQAERVYSASEHHRRFTSKFYFYSQMDLNIYIQLVFLCVVNILFACSGIVLNTLVIASFWKSTQLRKQLCHFMIMVLSCFDLVAVIIYYPGILLYIILWLKQDYDLLRKLMIYFYVITAILGFPLLALLVMSTERYLGAYYPVFHRTSVTRRRLLIPLAMLVIYQTTLTVLATNDLVISTVVHTTAFVVIIFPPFLFINFKLFKISRKVRRRKAVSPEQRIIINLKNTSSCLLSVACIVLLSIPGSVYIVFNINTKMELTSNAGLSHIWASSILAMNCTFNSLIFFWKNKVLRIEGIKILKTLKDRLFRF